MIKVLVVDDSAFVRQVFKSALEREPDICVIGTAPDPYVARDLIAKEVPDVITLDVEMPRMDGVTFLQRIMSFHPIPTIIVSSLTQSGSRLAIDALNAGAVEVFAKPDNAYSVGQLEQSLIKAVRAAAFSNVKKILPTLKVQKEIALSETTNKVLAIGASTGGPRAIEEVISRFNANCPPTIVVQHIPEAFSKAFANRLNSACKMEVREAVDGDTVTPGKVLIAPGSSHMLLKRSGANYYVELRSGPKVSGHCPSVDVMFRSVATNAGANAVGVLLTGMGADGARGMLEMKEAGAMTITQDEASCVVYGMPMQAVKLGASTKEIPLSNIADEIMSCYSRREYAPLRELELPMSSNANSTC